MQRRATCSLLRIFNLNKSNKLKVNNIHVSAIVKMVDKEELKKKLTTMQYHVTQEKGTERPFTGCYNKTYDQGIYVCIVCEQNLFSSDTKYDSGCGWPAFNDVLDQGKVKLSPDTSGVKAVIRRWANLRDAFSKSIKKLQDCKKNAKKYVYNDQMHFLNKFYVSKETTATDSLEIIFKSEEGTYKSEDEVADNMDMDEGVVHFNNVISQEKNTDTFGNRKRRKVEEINFKMLKPVEPENVNTHMLFFQGVMPHLSKFDDSEVLEFQMGVLRVISQINEKRKSTKSPTFSYGPQQISAHQPF